MNTAPSENVVLVVPCYNEAARFPVAVFEAFLRANPGISVVLVNDGSRDGTTGVLEALRAKLTGQVHVIDRKENRGKAESVREGLLYAFAQPSTKIAGFWDADLATPLDAVQGMLETLAARPHVKMVFGSRVNLLGRRIRRSPKRHYLGRVFATVVSLMLQLPLYDTQCGAKLFRLSAEEGREVFAEPFSSRWVFDVEIVARWIRLQRFDRERVRETIYEYPLEAWEDVGGSKVKPGDFVKAFVDVLRIWRRYLAG